jgi:hypothetical protein
MSHHVVPASIKDDHHPDLDDYHLPVEDYLNRNYGVGTWVRDPIDGRFVVWDIYHSGPGRNFILIDRDLQRWSSLVPAHRLN